MKEVISALFDFDGVVMDTESQYTHFWQQIGEDYGFPHLESQVKGQTLTYIYQTFFAGKESAQREITERLNRFEQQMQFLPVPGVECTQQQRPEDGSRLSGPSGSQGVV